MRKVKIKQKPKNLLQLLDFDKIQKARDKDRIVHLEYATKVNEEMKEHINVLDQQNVIEVWQLLETTITKIAEDFFTKPEVTGHTDTEKQELNKQKRKIMDSTEISGLKAAISNSSGPPA